MKSPRELLEELMDPDTGLLDKLLSLKTISRLEMNDIRSMRNVYEKNKSLLSYIEQKNNGYEQLKLALSEMGQNHLVNYFDSNGVFTEDYGDDWPLGEEESASLDANQEAIVDILDPTELINLLYSKKVINRRHMQILAAKPNEIEKNEMLMEIFSRSSRSNYSKIVECLRLSNQEHVANLLLHGGVVIQVHAEMDQDKESETKIVRLIKRLLRSKTPQEQQRIIALIQLQDNDIHLIEVRTSESIGLYFHCTTDKGLQNLYELIKTGRLKQIVEAVFRKLLHSKDLLIIEIRVGDTDYKRCTKYFTDILQWSKRQAPDATEIQTNSEERLKVVDGEKVCGLCKNLFISPRSLPCFHRFCLRCLEEYVGTKKTGSKISCPQCKRSVKIPVGGISSFSRNLFLDRLLSTTSKSEKQQKILYCDPCKECAGEQNRTPNLATKFCTDCDDNLCEDCYSEHKRQKPSRNHSLIELKNSASVNSTRNQCEKHPDETTVKYCKDCESLICDQCPCIDQRHNWVDMTQIGEESQSAIQEITEDILKLADEVTNYNLRNLLRDSVAETQSKIVEICEDINKATEYHKIELLEMLELIKTKRLEEIEAEEIVIKSHLSDLEWFLNVVETLQEKGSPRDFAEARSGVLVEASVLQNHHKSLRNRFKKQEDACFLQLTPVEGECRWWETEQNYIGTIRVGCKQEDDDYYRFREPGEGDTQSDTQGLYQDFATYQHPPKTVQPSKQQRPLPRKATAPAVLSTSDQDVDSYFQKVENIAIGRCSSVGNIVCPDTESIYNKDGSRFKTKFDEETYKVDRTKTPEIHEEICPPVPIRSYKSRLILETEDADSCAEIEDDGSSFSEGEYEYEKNLETQEKSQQGQPSPPPLPPRPTMPHATTASLGSVPVTEFKYGSVHIKGILRPGSCIYTEMCLGTVGQSMEVLIKRYSNEGRAQPALAKWCEFFREAEILGQLNHQNIIKLIGVSRSNPCYVITEWASRGYLSKFLKEDKGKTVKLKDIIHMSKQIANAMQYMCQKNCIHRQLDARNILIGDGCSVKLTNFEMAIFLDQHGKHGTFSDQYEILESPLKTRSPEVIVSQRWSTKSDVWSFGIVLYEILTHGGEPYAGLSDEQLATVMRTTNETPSPSRKGYSSSEKRLDTIMKCCWHKNPDRRPTFEYLYKFFLEYFTLGTKEDALGFLPHAELLRTIKQDGAIKGIALLNDRIYVIRRISREIEVYSTSSYKGKKSIGIDGEKSTVASIKEKLHLQSGNKHQQSGLQDIVSCSIQKCLYISDSLNRCIYQVHSGTKQITSWKIPEEPFGLSVTQYGNLIVSCRNASKLCEYTSNGELAHAIDIGNKGEGPIHGIEFSEDFVVSQGDVVCIYDNYSQIPSGTQRLELNKPSYLAIDSNDYVLVAETGGDRIIVLSPSLEFLRVLLAPDDNVIAPTRFYLDEIDGRLFVGLESGTLMVFRVKCNQGLKIKQGALTPPQSPTDDADYYYSSFHSEEQDDEDGYAYL